MNKQPAFIAIGVLCALIGLRLLGLPAAHAQSSTLSAVDLINIANSGGSLQIDASRFSAVDLINIANSASNSVVGKQNGPVKLTLLRVQHLSAVDLINIANSGKGCVTFVIDR